MPNNLKCTVLITVLIIITECRMHYCCTIACMNVFIIQYRFGVHRINILCTYTIETQ